MPTLAIAPLLSAIGPYSVRIVANPCCSVPVVQLHTLCGLALRRCWQPGLESGVPSITLIADWCGHGVDCGQLLKYYRDPYPPGKVLWKLLV
jgi:hypothetical protein